MKSNFKTQTPRETQQVAKLFANELQGGEVIALFGDLGTGKTTFVQGLAKGLGVKAKITSPTFVFMRSYPFVFKKNQLEFYHLDLYRGQTVSDFKSLGLDEIFAPENIVVLEWADKIKTILPKKRIDIFFKKENEKTRKIRIEKH